ncbi:MAG: GNAT family N-acetyltransferase [Clostridium sp.]|uniref:GNAT family N-acetyltransferase n=1 Tax=Clostridium sp. TaxID=1506 RepID=UPI002A8EB1A4|nr:GNAT family N-acetyltransferase [Clostridium sp.]MDY5097420.1 GNAT family N-acetyltransferase [Clostridium sp.]
MDRIYFEKFLSEDDFKYYSSLIFNEQVMAMNYGRIFNMDEANYLYEWMMKNNKDLGALGSFKVFQCNTNTFIGFAALLPNEDSTEAELEYMLLPDYWGQGYGTEIAMKLLRIAEGVDNLQTLTATVGVDNLASKNILLKTGFTHLKFFENDDNGSPVEMFTMDVTH